MRALAVLLALPLLTALPASARTDAVCGPPIQNYVPRLPAPGEAYVSVATDLRGLSPVKPAIVVNILLPAGAPPLVARGSFSLGLGDPRPPLAVARGEFWVLGPGPRASTELQGTAIFSSRSEVFQTQYKLYLRVPPEAAERFVVTFPDLLAPTRRLSIPPLAFHRTAGGPEVEICSVLPE